MASIIKRTEDVAKACEDALLHLEQFRKDAQESLITEKMAETLFGNQRYKTREAAIDALKAERDFFGSRWHTAQQLGWQTEADIKLLKSMCRCAGVIRLDSKDFALIRGHL